MRIVSLFVVWSSAVVMAAPVDSQLQEFLEGHQALSDQEVSTQLLPRQMEPEVLVAPKIGKRNQRNGHKMRRRGNLVPVGYNSFFGDNLDVVRNVFEIDELNLYTGKTKKDLYSGSYWPLKYGRIAYQYRGGSRTTGGRFSRNYNRRVLPPPHRSAESIDKLPPSAKYDLLIGDYNFTLTDAEWEFGRKQDRNGRSIRTWEGYCHAQAVAATREQHPLKPVTVRAAGGEMITFYPDDLKALSAGIWGSHINVIDIETYRNEFSQSGGNCSARRAPRMRDRTRNRDNTSSRCLDNNPGIFHIALVDLIGKKKESFVFDKSANSEIWNYPVKGYSFKFFNPNSGRRRGTSDVKSAIVKIEDFASDQFRGYRYSKTKYVVGVALEMDYIDLVSPNRRGGTEQPFSAKTKSVTYYYDLELDQHHNIIGGKWYQSKHPDIIWRAKPSTDPVISADATLGSFDLKRGSFPTGWVHDAKVSSRKSQPSAKIVRELIRLSRQ